MARENQGLQIALIILVILTIGLMLGTFFGWKDHQDLTLKAAEAVTAKGEATTAMGSAQNEANELKRMMGFQDADTLAVIQEEKNKDMQQYAPTPDKSSQVYREVIKQLSVQREQAAVARTAALDEVQKLKTRNEGLEKNKETQIQAAAKRADTAVADLAKERTAHNANRAGLEQQTQDLQARVTETQRTADEQLTASQDKLTEANRRVAIKTIQIKERNKQLDNILKPTFEVADGKVMWVNQRAGIVWINLGQADALERQTSFAIYPSETSDVTDARSKANIEITQIHGAHLAEARIVDDTITDPIMPGDLIHTPVWAPGKRQHFALNWGIDIDDDGKSDLDLVRNVISMNGGIVDFWLDADGQSHGEMTTATRYLIMGDEPGVNDKPAVIRSFSSVNSRAAELGVRSMPVVELLARMGWTNQSPVVRYGLGAKSSDFKAKPPEGVPRTSSGNVSPLYKNEDRRPPHVPGKSAY
jgi:hypothetical protein